MVSLPHIDFLSHVDVCDFDRAFCWTWLGAGKGNGYGHCTHEGRNLTAHRKAYLLFRGPIAEGMDVCHTCDHRWCVNPAHLFLATREGNMRDCKAKGRTSGHYRKHLKEHVVQEIRRRINAGAEAAEIAGTMGISYQIVNSIRTGRRYVGIGE